MTFTMLPLSGDVSSEAADFVGVRLIRGICRPSLSLIMGGLHRFHEHIQLMEDDIGIDGRTNAPLRRPCPYQLFIRDEIT